MRILESLKLHTRPAEFEAIAYDFAQFPEMFHRQFLVWKKSQEGKLHLAAINPDIDSLGVPKVLQEKMVFIVTNLGKVTKYDWVLKVVNSYKGVLRQFHGMFRNITSRATGAFFSLLGIGHTGSMLYHASTNEFKMVDTYEAAKVTNMAAKVAFPEAINKLTKEYGDDQVQEWANQLIIEEEMADFFDKFARKATKATDKLFHTIDRGLKNAPWGVGEANWRSEFVSINPVAAAYVDALDPDIGH